MTQMTQIITKFNLLKMSDLKKITCCFLRSLRSFLDSLEKNHMGEYY